VVTFDTDEATFGSVHFGQSCGSLTETASQSGYGTSHTVNLTGLDDDATYFYVVEAEDEAGNAATDDNGGACYSFTTPGVPDHFTEEYGGDADLDGLSLIFTPNGSEDYYGSCVEPITELPTDPAGGTTISLSDDDYEMVTLFGGMQATLYGMGFTSFYVGSNGYITFTGGDSDYTESLTDHFDTMRVSGLFDDLNPSTGGTVSWEQLYDRAVVTWENVPEYGTSNANTFQIELYVDGTIVISHLEVASGDNIVGLSEGVGLSPDFYETDLSSMGPCGPPEITAARSCLTHGGAGELCLELEVTDVEPRQAGLEKLVFDLSSAVSAVEASVDCVNQIYAGTVEATADGATVTVGFSPALADQDCCTVTLSGEVEDEFVVRTLAGDVDRDGTVSTADASVVKPHFGEPADAGNAQYDYDCNGAVTTGDFSVIKPLFGHELTCP
jgi:hypothetical protein